MPHSARTSWNCLTVTALAVRGYGMPSFGGTVLTT